MFIYLLLILLLCNILYRIEINKPINNNTPIIKKEIIIKPIKINNPKKEIIYNYLDIPEMRGLVKKYNNKDKHEIGGNKIFNHIKLNNSNMNINKVNYNSKYSSYRKKPFSFK